MNKLRTLIPWSKQRNIIQPLIRNANDCFLYDNKNRKIVDFTSGLMVVNLGHNNQYIKNGIKEHINNGIAYIPSSFATYERDKLSDRLISISNMNQGKVFYTNGGADSNETAIFLSLETNSTEKKKRIISFTKSYHGGSSYITSLIGGDNRRENKNNHYSSKNLKLEPIIPNPCLKEDGKTTLEFIENNFKKGDICSILLEGSSGSAGIYLYPKNFLKKIRKLCDEYDVTMIVDEVMSGFGRTGSFFAFQQHEIIPDMITCAKGLTSGYVPLGCVIVNQKISDYFKDKNLNQGLTYYGHTLACTAANRCLDIYMEKNMKLINQVNDKSIILQDLGAEIKKNNEYVIDYRCNGFLGGFELDNNVDEMKKIEKNLFSNNVYCYIRNNFIFTAPPLIINESLIYKTMNTIKTCIDNSN